MINVFMVSRPEHPPPPQPASSSDSSVLAEVRAPLADLFLKRYKPVETFLQPPWRHLVEIPASWSPSQEEQCLSAGMGSCLRKELQGADPKVKTQRKEGRD